jgi:hypothetical protein
LAAHPECVLGVMTVRYAVLMKVHYWDDFVERRFQHLLSKVGTGDLYVFVDETHGPVGEIPHDRVIRVNEHDLNKLEVLPDPLGKVFWFNADYPLYFLYSHSTYDYYLMCEYDTVFNVEIDNFVRTAAADNVDYVGFPLTDKFRTWPWSQTCDGVYPGSVKLYNWLNAISLHSKRSVEFLFKRRQSLTCSYKMGDITHWPYSEAFIPTEMQNNGFVVRSLGDFGKVEKYNWWPPSHERDLPSLQNQDFLHPVLDELKYTASCLRFGSLQSYFFRNGQLRRLLARSTNSQLAAMPAFLAEVIRRIRLRAFASR